MKYQKDWTKFIIGWLAVFAIRLFPYRPPNVEPVLATLMPFSKRYGYVGGFFFAFLSIVLFDLVVGQVGMWTWITAVAYGAVGVGAYFFLRRRNATAWNFAVYGVIGTIAYDAVSGWGGGPLFFGQPLQEAFWGQIPFTLAHLAGTVTLSLIMSPALYYWVLENKRFEANAMFGRWLKHGQT